MIIGAIFGVFQHVLALTFIESDCWLEQVCKAKYKKNKLKNKPVFSSPPTGTHFPLHEISFPNYQK